MKVHSKRVFLEKPAEKTGVVANTYYTGENNDLMCLYSNIHKSDTSDIGYKMFSEDNGRTWGKPEVVKTEHKVTGGTLRDYCRSPIIDEKRHLFINFGVKGILPSDDPIDGLKWWHVYYKVSYNQGKTDFINEAVILEGEEFNAKHPVDDVFEGKNAVMMGDTTELAIITRHQTNEEDNDCILLPVQITPIGPDGSYYNPGGGYTFHYAAVIRGAMQDDGHIKWKGISNKATIDHKQSTRGAIEPTIIELDDGRILMVLRGSNGGTIDINCDIPGYRWYCISTDGGKTFSKVIPWTYDDGEAFYSPSSCSQLLKHSNGKIYWLGNISPSNPKANMPRNPIYICEVNQENLLLKKETLCIIDKVEKGQSLDTTFSNFYAREDRESNHIIVHITPFHVQKDNIFGSHSYIYEIEV